ncbi:MAG: UTP--glucose-1-phosphate uridylyltransferase, partial [Bacteriovoracaceae bacterium]|nr:UTP--glucose-1-phosphate uridylyltransferase [Bacteriovoracaceae bacterium]
DIITPDVILNAKGTPDHPYYQLEGAMGSVLLNLDRFWRKYYGKPLVHLINIELPHRTSFFSPLKTAFDFFLQFYSDRFTFDEERFRPINQRPGKFPVVLLQDKFYKEVDNVLLAFAKTSTIDLDELTIKGQVLLANFTLQGKVIIDNQSGHLVDLTKIDEQILPRTLHNQKVVLDASGKVQLLSLA